ncbi:MAG: HYR domain-containing protein [Bacteroidetes bacterium]|nr:HYR domain-containing protein [Bacteroidota bacterium]
MERSRITLPMMTLFRKYIDSTIWRFGSKWLAVFLFTLISVVGFSTTDSCLEKEKPDKNSNLEGLSLLAESETINCTDSGPVSVDFIVQNDIDLTSLQFSLTWNSSVLSYIDSTILIFTSGFSFGNLVETTPNDTLTFSWFSGTAVSFNAGDVLFTLNYDFNGAVNSSSPIEFISTPTPIQASLADFSTTMVTTQNGSVNFVDDPPTLNCPGDVTEVLPQGQANMVITGIEAQNVGDDCGAAALTYTLSGATVAGPSSGDANGLTFNQGLTMVTYTVMDEAGQVTECTFQVQVSGANNGEVHLAVRSTDVPCNANMVEVDITVEDIIVMTSLQFSLTWDAAALDFVETQNVFTASDVNFGPAMQTPPIDTLTFSWFDANGVVFGHGDVLFTLKFNATGAVGTSTEIQFIDTPTPMLASDAAFELLDAIPTNGQISFLEDTQPPSVLSSPNIIQKFTDNGACGSIVTYSAPLFEDDCDGTNLTGILTSGLASGSLFPVGTTMVVYTYTDGGGNSIPASFNVTIADNEDPEVLNCPSATIVQATDPGMCTAQVVWTAPSFSDNCEIVQSSQTHSSGDIFPLGMTEVVFTGEDAAGNSVECSFFIEVQDQEAPAISCPDQVTISCTDSADPTINADIGFATATDNCSGTISIVPTVNISSDGCTDTGTISWTATDVAGNASSCQQTITVSDNNLPVFDALPAAIADISCNDPFPSHEVLTATDDCGSATVSVMVDTFLSVCSGYPVTYRWIAADDCGNTSEVTQTFNVLPDTENPYFIYFPNDLTVDIIQLSTLSASAVEAYLINNSISGPVAGDNCGGTLTTESSEFLASGFNCPVLAVYQKHYTLMDDCQNSIQQTFTVRIMDNTAPIAQCKDYDIQLGLNDIATIQVEDIDNGSYDAFSPISLQVDQTSFNCSDIGTNLVSLTATDACGNQSTCTAIVTVLDNLGICGTIPFSPQAGDRDLLVSLFGESNVPPTILDPCDCRNNLDPIDNGTTTDAGLFSDEIVVVSRSAGDNWEVVGTSDARPLPYAFTADPTAQLIDLTPLVSGTSLIFVGNVTIGTDVFYIYSLKIIHRDATGYSIRLRESNGLYDSFDLPFIGNTCYYPDPIILNVEDAYTTDCTDPITISGSEMNAVSHSNYQLRLDGPDPSLPMIVSPPAVPAITFVPGSLAVGTYTVTFTFDAGSAGSDNSSNPGCEETVVTSFQIVPPTTSFICNNNVMVALNQDCSSLITPDAVLEGDQAFYGIFDVNIFDIYGNSIGDIVTASQVDQTLDVVVTDNCTGNFCEGTITVVDNLAPIFECSADPIEVSCSADLDNYPAPSVFDYCDPDFTLTLLNEQVVDLDCSGTGNATAQMTRWYRATDASGNSSTCQQIINLVKYSLDDVVFPSNYDDFSLPAVDCSNPITDPSVTGYPTIQGAAIGQGGYCRMIVSYEDQILNTCGNSYKTYRTWTVYDWCDPLDDVNPLTHLQIIKVIDSSAPQITCPSDLTVGASNSDCTAFFILPAADVSDDCSDYTVQVATPTGLIFGNGGVINGLPMGTHEITYTVTDDCGNSNSCTTNVTVIDNISPVAICDEFTVVTLNSTGAVLVSAEAFDDASYDDCSYIIMSARRMDDPTDDLGPSVVFDCGDVDQEVTIIFRVTDGYGNYNECMVTVHVQDKTAPILQCPSDITLGCTEDYTDIAVTGSATVLEGCILQEMSNEILSNTVVLNSCGEGVVVRQFTAVDGSGNEAVCTQTITVENTGELFDASMISWPSDVTLTNICGPDLEPENLPTTPINYSQPMYSSLACSQLAVSHTDEYFDGSNPACFGIIRRWAVIDWCQYDPNENPNIGRWEHIQTLEVIDTQAPVILSCQQDTTVNILSADCLGSVELVLPVAMDCSDDITYSVSGDLGNSFGTVQNLEAGNYTVTYTATDGCGNSATCDRTITLVDGKPPVGVCINHLATVPMPSSGTIDISATLFIIPSSIEDNCSDFDEIIVSFSTDITDTVRTYTCDSLGMNEISIWLTDAEGNNFNICQTFLDIQDTGACVGSATAILAGLIFMEEGTAVEQVEVEINSQGSPSIETGNNGAFAFTDLLFGNDYSVTPQKDFNHANGVSTMDQITVLRHINGDVPITSPYKLIAADVNKSGTVSTADMIQIRKIILGIDTIFPNNTSWRFVDAAYVFPFPENPFFEPFPEIFNVNNLDDELEADFVGVKTGDVNGDVLPNMLTEADDRDSRPTLPFVVIDQFLRKGEKVEIPFRTSENIELLGAQFTLEFESEALQFSKLKSGQLMNEQHFGLPFVSEGKITVSWGSIVAETISKEDILFTLVFEVEQDMRLSEVLEMNSSITKAEAYDAMENIQNPEIVFQEDPLSSDQLRVFPSSPNPFSDFTYIRFSLPESDEVRLSVYTADGRLLWTERGDYIRGYNQIHLDANKIPAQGMLIFKLETSSENAVGKAVLKR